MSEAAQHLINQMIMIDPKQRLGHDLDSIKILRTHPFFQGVNFERISTPQFKDLRPLVTRILPKLGAVMS